MEEILQQLRLVARFHFPNPLRCSPLKIGPNCSPTLQKKTHPFSGANMLVVGSPVIPKIGWDFWPQKVAFETFLNIVFFHHDGFLPFFFNYDGRRLFGRFSPTTMDHRNDWWSGGEKPQREVYSLPMVKGWRIHPHFGYLAVVYSSPTMLKTIICGPVSVILHTIRSSNTN